MNGKYLFYFSLVLIVLSFYFGSLTRIFGSGILTILFTAGAFLGTWAFYNIGSKNYSPFPEPKKGSKLVQKGVYKYIRHPMYTGVLLTCLSLFLSNASFTSFLIFAVLCYVFDTKAAMEEELLTKMHKEYQHYTANTKKFIPYIY